MEQKTVFFIMWLIIKLKSSLNVKMEARDKRYTKTESKVDNGHILCEQSMNISFVSSPLISHNMI